MRSSIDPAAARGAARQFFAFAGVGFIAASVHYGTLVGLVEFAGWHAVRAALIGYAAGGIISYGLNRRQVFGSDRPHREAGWRFAGVAAVGFCFTYAFMHVFVDWLALPYLPAQI